MSNYFSSVKHEITGKTNLVLYYILLAYILSLFLKDAPVVSNILMSVIFVLSLAAISKENFRDSIRKNKVLLGIIFFFLLQILSLFLSEDKKEGAALILRRLPLFLLPASFIFINFPKKIWNKIALFYAVTTTLASVIGFTYGAYSYFISKDSGFLYNDNISLILSKQAVYFAFYVSVAIVIFAEQLNQHSEHIIKYRPYFLSAVIWLLFIVFMLASRSAMLSLLFIFFCYVSFQIVRKKKYLEGMLFVLCIVVGVVILSKLFPKTLNRFQGTTETNFQYENKNVENHFNAAYDSSKWNGTNTRIAIWECAVEVWETNPITGTGIGDRTGDLNKKYQEKKFWYALHTNKNTHNQYLDILISMGITGLVLFIILFFIYPIYTFIKEKQILAMIIFVMLAISLVTENMFDRYQGLIFIPFILSLATKIADEKEDPI
ncbi:MAG: hypothetical protein A3F72_21620 [Bacteroidetes bacterium RIFCSPLOWO2_12_FULL_35_15]|nr:MAG: hypothetical protein A3F72_21620 [Bacteroidetes bacterium RIFCSPLOWO2_12_FULL_35_15]